LLVSKKWRVQKNELYHRFQIQRGEVWLMGIGGIAVWKRSLRRERGIMLNIGWILDFCSLSS